MENCFWITWIHLVVTQKSQDLGKFTIGDFNNLGLIYILKCYMHIVYCEITGYFLSKVQLIVKIFCMHLNFKIEVHAKFQK